MTTPSLLFKQQQNIAQSHVFPFITVLEKTGTAEDCCCEAPCEWNLKKLVRSEKNSIRRRECDQPGSFSIIHLEVIAV
jgi:hypothetical protein